MGLGQNTRDGLVVDVYKGYDICMLGAGYNCPRLGLFGYRTDTALKRAISKKLKARAAV